MLACDINFCSVDKPYIYEIAVRKHSFFLEHVPSTKANTATEMGSWMKNPGFIEEEDYLDLNFRTVKTDPDQAL